jgi:hypothetical protein
VAHIVGRMVVATLTEERSWLSPVVRSLLLHRSEWSAGRAFVGIRGGGAAGRTKPVKLREAEARANDRLRRLVRYYAEPNILCVPRDSK